MTSILRLLLLGAFVVLPVGAFAQEAVLSGTVADSTGAVLPGVTVTAVHEATGNRFVAVTDERGTYRIPARVGAYQITAELQGFATVSRTGVQLLVGQVATVNLQMAPSRVQETVTVTAESPLIATTTSSLGGNIDPRQVQELPVQGRNWMALAMLAPGSRMTSPTATTPLTDRNTGEQREFQFSIDGQQVASELGFGAQPRYSQESIAEFQFISNRFDATQGRSTGVQVRAITKSGANTFSGSLRGNFRDSQMNARNPVLDRVVPIDNQQLGSHAWAVRSCGTGCISSVMRNTSASRRPASGTRRIPRFNVELDGLETIKMGGVRLDYQFSPQMRMMGKLSEGRRFRPFDPGNTSHPAATGSTAETNREDLVQLTQVMGHRAVNEISAGYARWIFRNANLTTWSNHWQAANGVTTGSPRITFTNFTIGGNTFYPRHGAQDIWSVRDDFTFSYTARGRHDLRAGAEYLRYIDDGNNCQVCMGRLNATNGRRSGQYRGALSRPLQRRHLEHGGDLPAGADLRHRHRGLRHPRHPAAVRRLVAGRLADLLEPDAEPRRAL